MSDDCTLCNRPHRPRCECGEMNYADGSSRICPNWSDKLEEPDPVVDDGADRRWHQSRTL